MPVADGDVTLIPERVVGQAVFSKILINVVFAPVDDRVNFRYFVLCFDYTALAARAGLTATEA